jgi:hypothetical protein
LQPPITSPSSSICWHRSTSPVARRGDRWRGGLVLSGPVRVSPTPPDRRRTAAVEQATSSTPTARLREVYDRPAPSPRAKTCPITGPVSLVEASWSGPPRVEVHATRAGGR